LKGALAGRVGLLGLLTLGVGIFDHEVWSPSETTVSGVVWNMVEGGSSLVLPRINDLAYLEKPPLYYWAGWASAKLAGRLDAGTLRLPAALFGLLALAALAAVLRPRWGDRVTWATLFLGVTTLPFFELSHRASSDVAATAGAFLCFALFARSLDGPQAGSRRRTLLLDGAFSLALAFSFYAKNFYVFLVVIPPVAALLVWRRQWARLLRMALLGSAATLVVVLPWLLALRAEGGDLALRVVLFDNTLGRLLTLHPPAQVGPLNNAFGAEKKGSWLYYLVRLPALAAPWSGIALMGARRCLQRRPRGDLQRFTLLGLVGVPLALTLSSSKASEYLTPVLFFVWLACAELLAELRRGAPGLGRGERWVLLASLLAMALLLAGGGIGLALLRGQPALLALALPPLVAGALWVRRARRSLLDLPGVLRASQVIALCLGLLTLLAMPLLDAHKSQAPFFSAAARRAAGRRVLTTYLGDHTLPLMTYYLRRRVEVHSYDEVLALLAAREPVLAVLPGELYDAAPARIDGISGVRVSILRGHRDRIFAWNRQPAPRGDPSRAGLEPGRPAAPRGSPSP